MKINNLETFLKKIRSGDTALGVVITCRDISIAELAADAGFDFLWLDLEHSPLTLADAMNASVAVRGTDCALFVRVPWNENYLLKPVLDLAPAGVIVPMILNADDARAAVRACRYPADGGERGFALRRQNRYGADPWMEYLEQSIREPLVILQIEHRQAVENLDSILAVPGIDSLCIGPADLSSSFGKTLQFDDPEIENAIRTICRKAEKAGVPVGGFCSDSCYWSRFPLSWKAVGSDSGILFDAFRSKIAENRALDCTTPSALRKS